jgi:hypothetical protein
VLSSLKRAIVFETHRFIYVEIAKAACSSIKHSLGKALSIAPEVVEEWKNGNLTTVDLADPRYAGYFKFTFVRNPWDRAVSCYENKFNDPDPNARASRRLAAPLAQKLGVSKVSFEQFVQYISQQPDEASDVHWKSQTSSLFDGESRLLVDYVGRFENIGSDFQHVCSVVGLDAKLAHILRTRHRKPYRDYYSDITRELVRARYADDISAFSYSF